MKYVYIHSSVETTMGGFRYRSAIVYTHRICNYVSIPAKLCRFLGGGKDQVSPKIWQFPCVDRFPQNWMI